MFKNILCPIDLKPRSKMALRKALNIAHQFNSSILILNVNENFSSKKEMIMSRISVSKLQNEFNEKHLSLHSSQSPSLIFFLQFSRIFFSSL